jgi:hypothetical protein
MLRLSMTRVAFLIALISSGGHAASRREALLFSHCPRQSGEFQGSYRGRILLHKQFLDKDSVETSIEQQLKYLWGFYRNDAAAHGAMQVTLSAEPREITILSTKEVPYGRDLPLPYPTTEERLKIEDPYTLRAVARGRVEKDDPALLVEYQIRFKLAACGHNQDPPPLVHVPLPLDPWLAYWYVDQKNHRPLRYYDERAVTNPCSDNDFADLPHPFYYWYDWLPTRHGPDDAGRSFDCRAWLKPGDHYHYFDVQLERVSAASHDFSRLRALLGDAPLSATILVGVTNHGMTDLKLALWRDRLEGGDITARATQALQEWSSQHPRDAGTANFLAALADLRAVVEVERHRTFLDGEYLVSEVEGQLKQSGRRLRARLWLGLTDIFGPKPPQHWRILRQALAEDQIVLYVGHSGIGENFRLAQLEQHLGISHQQMTAELRRSSWRLIAFISCYSYMYFGQDLLDAGAQSQNGGYFVFTGMETNRHTAGPVALLDLVDRVLRAPDGRVDKLPLLGDNDFWLVKEVLGVSGGR